MSFLEYIKYLEDKISQHKDNNEQKKLLEKIMSELKQGDIRVCIYCSGFVDIEENECPHCFKSLGVQGDTKEQRTIALHINDVNNNTIKYTNEGIYIGRYSRGESLILNT